MSARARGDRSVHEDRIAAPARDAVRPGGVRPVVLHGRRRPAAVRPAVARRRLRDDRVVRPLEHAGAGAVDVDAASAVTAQEPRFFERLRSSYRERPRRGRSGCAGRSSASICVAALAFIADCCCPRIGTEIFPTVDTSQFQLRLRAPTGTRIERTELIALKALDVIKQRGRTGQRRDHDRRSSACSRRAIRSTRSICSPAARTKRCWRVAEA